MMSTKFAGSHFASAESLPPAEFWVGCHPNDFLYPDNRILTPTDERGLIKIDDLIEDVKAFIDPDYEWPEDTSVHHIYHARQNYHDYAAYLEDPTPVIFRELAPNKIRVPRSFENVLHRVTLEPIMPDLGVMRQYIEAWAAARGLFQSVSRATQISQLAQSRQENQALTTDEQDAGQAITDEMLRRHFRGVGRHLGALTLIPQEFWAFSSTLQVPEAAEHVNTVVRRNHRPYTHAVLGSVA